MLKNVLHLVFSWSFFITDERLPWILQLVLWLWDLKYIKSSYFSNIFYLEINLMGYWKQKISYQEEAECSHSQSDASESSVLFSLQKGGKKVDKSVCEIIPVRRWVRAIRFYFPEKMQKSMTSCWFHNNLSCFLNTSIFTQLLYILAFWAPFLLFLPLGVKVSI